MRIGYFVAVTMFLFTGCNSERYMGRSSFSWAQDLENDLEFKRRDACKAFSEMPVAAKERVDALAERLADVNPGIREFCRDALIVAGDVAKPTLQRILANEDPLVRLQAAAALVAIDPADGQAKEVIAQGVVAVGNADVSALANEISVKSGAPMVVVLLNAMATGDAAQRIAVLSVLGKMRRHAKGAETKLFDVIRLDGDATVRQAAMQALLGIASAKSLRPALQDLIKDPNEDVASHAAVMLRRLGGT